MGHSDAAHSRIVETLLPRRSIPRSLKVRGGEARVWAKGTNDELVASVGGVLRLTSKGR